VELRVYKQRIAVTTNLQCRFYERRPRSCAANLDPIIKQALHPELILKYLGITIGDKTFQPSLTANGMQGFQARDADYSGEQRLEVELIYLK
jgi:hypothetical protein